MQLCSSLSILWHCLSLGLEWKLSFSSPVATVEFSKFSGILSAALSQHHLSGFEISQLEFCYPLNSMKANPMNSMKRQKDDTYVSEWVKSLSHVQLFATPWTIAYPAPQSMGFFQTRILEWSAISFSRGSSQPRDRTWVSCTADRRFTIWATREADTYVRTG